MAHESTDSQPREKREICTAIGIAIGLLYGAAIQNVGVGFVAGAAAGILCDKSVLPLLGFLLLAAVTWVHRFLIR